MQMFLHRVGSQRVELTVGVRGNQGFQVFAVHCNLKVSVPRVQERRRSKYVLHAFLSDPNAGDPILTGIISAGARYKAEAAASLSQWLTPCVNGLPIAFVTPATKILPAPR
jgi:hypothetical protein